MFKPTLVLADGKVKGNVDAEMVLHAMIEYGNYDKAVLVTGDGDFACLVDYLMKKDKLLRLIIPDRHNYSSLLARLNPKMAFLNELNEKLGRTGSRKIKGSISSGQNPSDSFPS